MQFAVIAPKHRSSTKTPHSEKKGTPLWQRLSFRQDGNVDSSLLFLYYFFFYASIAKKSPTGRSWSAKPLFPPLTHTHTRWKSAKENVNEKSVLLGWKRGVLEQSETHETKRKKLIRLIIRPKGSSRQKASCQVLPARQQHGKAEAKNKEN